jgi:flagellar biosynthetic protein FliO
MFTVIASLVLVLGLFLLVAWLLRKTAPAGGAVLPKEVFEVLGRAPLASRQQVHLVRCGRKLLLLSVSPGGIETLSEIDDPLEVDRLAGLCVQAQPGSASMVFRQVFQQFSAPQGRVTRDAEPPAEIRHA